MAGHTNDAYVVDSAAAAVADARRRSHARRTARWLTLGLLVFAVAFWTVSLVWESWSERDISALVSRVTQGKPASDDLLSMDAEETADPKVPSDYLPSAVDGWTVHGIQPVPGSNGKVIEGHYAPADEERSLVTPVVVYVQAADVRVGQDFVAEALAARYTESAEEYAIDGVLVRSGASADAWSYFIGWTHESKVYGVDASFRYRVPATGGPPILRSTAEEIARAVMRHTPGRGEAE